MERVKRVVITGGPSVGKVAVFEKLRELGFKCSEGEIAREIYRSHKQKLERHLLVGDRREYSIDVLNAFIKEYCDHKNGTFFFNRGIPDGIGWERFFGLEPARELLDANKAYRYDAVFVLDPVEKFEDEHDVIWAKERESQRIHQLIIQGYVDSGYDPIFVKPDFVEKRTKFIISNI